MTSSSYGRRQIIDYDGDDDDNENEYNDDDDDNADLLEGLFK